MGVGESEQTTWDAMIDIAVQSSTKWGRRGWAAAPVHLSEILRPEQAVDISLLEDFLHLHLGEHWKEVPKNRRDVPHVRGRPAVPREAILTGDRERKSASHDELPARR